MSSSWRWIIPLLTACQTVSATESVTKVPEVVVTANRMPQTADESLAPVSVVTREDIERLQAQSIQDVLRGLPGVAVANNGGRGKVTSVFLRGAESDHVLVLIDGIKVGSATLGSFAFQDMPVEQIERIEVVRGPRASLYGSEAIGGVIQIFTRRGTGDVKPYGRVAVGSRGTYETSFGLSGGGDRGWFNLGGTTITTDGINACDGTPAAGCFTALEPDKDGHSAGSASARVGYRFDSGTEVEAHVLQTRNSTQFDGTFQNESESRQNIIGGKVSFSPLEVWQASLSGGRSLDKIESFKDGVFASQFITRRDHLTVQNDFEIGDDHLVTVGADYQRDRVDGSTTFDETARRNRGIFGQFLGSFGDHDIQVALRNDDNEQFGSSTTGSAAWGWQFHPAVRVRASYGTAFKAPTFNELYFPAFGNRNLTPEESKSFEVGLSGNLESARWSVNAFRSQVDDLIAFDATTFAPANIGEAEIHGLEAALAARVLGFDWSSSLTLLDPRNRGAGANQDNQLARRPKQVLRVDVDRAVGKFSFGATVVAEGARFDDLANTRRIGGFATTDLRAQYRFNSEWTVQARIENLLDKGYETASFFNQPGRGVFFTLRYQP